MERCRFVRLFRALKFKEPPNNTTNRKPKISLDWPLHTLPLPAELIVAPTITYLNADKVESRHRREKLVVIEAPGQTNVKVLEHLEHNAMKATYYER